MIRKDTELRNFPYTSILEYGFYCVTFQKWVVNGFDKAGMTTHPHAVGSKRENIVRTKLKNILSARVGIGNGFVIALCFCICVHPRLRNTHVNIL